MESNIVRPSHAITHHDPAECELYSVTFSTESTNGTMRGAMDIVVYWAVLGASLTKPSVVDAWTLERNSNERLSQHSSDSIVRRQLLASFAATSSLGVFIIPIAVAKAATPLDAGEAIRRSAATIPGYGQTDVFFPASLAGNWIMIREVDFGNGREPLRLSYPIRFLRSIEDDAVVADRGFNQAALEQAIVEAVYNDSENSPGRAVQSYEWVQTNPNDLRLVLESGKRKEIKVTKRSTERTESTVSSSEFQRITQEDQGGIPEISARRVVTKWKVVDDTTLEGMEIIYNMGGGDPMSASSSTSSNPTVLSKSKMILQR